MIDAAEAEKRAGILCYATEGPRCSGRAKSTPEDFRVEEVIDTSGMTDGWSAGRYPLYRVEKASVDTMHMASELGAALRSRVSYAGMKDNKAVAVQYATPTSLRSMRPERVDGQRFTATLAGYIDKPLSRASVLANRFDIVLRGCCPEVGSRTSEAFGLAGAGKVPNFFGLQRFGTSGRGTHEIGRAIVKGEFERAVGLLLAGGSIEASEAATAGRYRELLGLLHPGKDVEKRVARSLVAHPGEWVRALRAVPIRLRRLYVQAYQSFIFNMTLSAALKRGDDISRYVEGDNWGERGPDGLVVYGIRGVKEAPTGNAVPLVQLVGYAYRDYGSRFDGCVKDVLSSEEVKPDSFYVKEMQEVSSEGGFRPPRLAVRETSFEVDGDVASLRFTLARGQYATVLLREILKPVDPGASGLA
ncbi:MAG: tRNA pseudouridine(13) synthase TruD [Nitrososphaerota archaeon]|nr:tRNA pseudouridine(13) synthase TruD [Nitrososphaerota archaeon]MDG6942201.1 tRNA pseudouridine(13) synthase TruD [Nitrososphaerota archaeon]MDG6942666.1 tRNA pseudouridine(13) synthase TruD [Nitrososphaerota archaeon]MDG6948453.1 tRNA pseudouridine(13) synthase TruD [Nitrososphaerota archaeon]MDG6950379.1 tRNA pseudouridine(13) synthase TruD [Nitrososphaerota archaeon]